MTEEASRDAAAYLPHLAGAIVLGSAMALDPGGWYPFGPTKWFVVSTLVAGTAMYALACRLRPRLPRWGSMLIVLPRGGPKVRLERLCGPATTSEYVESRQPSE